MKNDPTPFMIIIICLLMILQIAADITEKDPIDTKRECVKVDEFFSAEHGKMMTSYKCNDGTVAVL